MCLDRRQFLAIRKDQIALVPDGHGNLVSHSGHGPAVDDHLVLPAISARNGAAAAADELCVVLLQYIAGVKPVRSAPAVHVMQALVRKQIQIPDTLHFRALRDVHIVVLVDRIFQFRAGAERDDRSVIRFGSRVHLQVRQ